MGYPLFVLDTSAFTNSWRRFFPPEVFPGFWNLIGRGIVEGWIRSVADVRRELAEDKHEDGQRLLKWIDGHSKLFIAEDEDVNRSLREVSSKFAAAAKWDVVGEKPNADPWIAAVSRLHSAVPVTHDGFDSDWNIRFPSKGGKLWLAHVCKSLGLDPLTPLGMVRRLGASFPDFDLP